MFCCADCARALIQVSVKTVVTTRPDFEHPRWGEDFTYSMEMRQMLK